MAKDELSLRERTYRALTDIAVESPEDGATEAMVVAAVMNWTTDPVTDDGTFGPDASALFSYIVNHLHSQDVAEETMAVASQVIAKIDAAGVDASLLVEHNSEEWSKLMLILATNDREDFKIPDTLDDLLAEAGESAPFEATADEHVRKVLLEKVDQHAKIGQILAQFLMAAHTLDMDAVHSLLDTYGCGLVHAVTALLFSWVMHRQTLDDDMDVSAWIADISATSARVLTLPEEERLQIASQFLVHGDDDYEEEDEDDEDYKEE